MTWNWIGWRMMFGARRTDRSNVQDGSKMIRNMKAGEKNTLFSDIKKTLFSDIEPKSFRIFVVRPKSLAKEPAMLAIEVRASNFCARETRGTKAKFRTLADTWPRAANNSSVSYMFQKPTNLDRNGAAAIPRKSLWLSRNGGTPLSLDGLYGKFPSINGWWLGVPLF